MKKDWLWDKNIDEQQVKTVLLNIEDKQFVSYAALLLSRNNSAQEVFSDFISRENFFVAWNKIKKQMRKNTWNDSRIEYWQAIYDTLKEELPELKKIKTPASLAQFGVSELPMSVSVFSISREIGVKIKLLREQAGLTQKDLAKRLRISQQIISRIEGGKQNVSVETLSSICDALGVPFTAEKLGFQIEPEKSEKTDNIFPFSSKSPEEFVKIVFEIIERSKEEYSDPQYYDGPGDKGRDIVVYKYSVGKKERWYFQCKRYSKVSFSDFKAEIDKIVKYSQEDTNFRPDGIVFVTACKISVQCKDNTKVYVRKVGLGEVLFWTDVELTAKAKAAGVYDDLFPITNKELKERADDIKHHVTSSLFEAGLLTEQSQSSKNETNKDIDEAVKEIHRDNIEKAKQILIKIQGQIENNPNQFKKELARTYNNLGVCFNNPDIDRGDYGEAEKYFQLALNIKPDFIKAKINLASVYLNRGGVQNLQKAYDLSMSLWQDFDKKDSTIFEVYIWSKFHYQSPQEALIFYETSREAQSLVEKDEKLSNLMATIYFSQKNIDKSEKLINQALKLAPQTPYNLMLKARIFIRKAQNEDILTNVFEVIPMFKKTDNIEEAISFLNQAEEELKKNTNKRAVEFLRTQIKYDISICMLWLRRFEEYETAQRNIDFEKLDPVQKEQLGINDVMIEIQKRNFEIAYSNLVDSKDWQQLPYKEKVRIAHILFLKGAPQQSKDIYLSIEKEAEIKKDMWFCIDMSLNEVLLGDKYMAIKYAEKVKNFATDASKEKVAYSHYNALMMRYASDNEVDRLMTGLFEYDKKFPENKVIRSIKATEEDGSISEEFKSTLLNQKEWYEGIKKMFRDQPVPSYFLEKSLRRTYAEILSFRSWGELDFEIELTLPDKRFEDNLINNFEKAEKLVFDYASLLNLSKMNLLGYLEKLGKEIYVSEKLFDKIQYELLQVEQEDLRNLWRFLKDSKVIHMIDDSGLYINQKKYTDLFDKWLVESLYLAKKLNAVFVVDDLRLIKFFQSEEAIKGCNSFVVLKSLLKKEWIDAKIYATSIGDLAERFYTFLPFSGEDLFQIVKEDQILIANKSKISLRVYHLVDEMFLPGSIVQSFTAVFVKFISLLWDTGALPDDKVKWLSFLTNKIVEFVEKRIGEGSKQDLEQVVPDFVQMWIIAVQKSSKDEILLLEKRVDKVFEAPAFNIFKDNVSRFIKTKKTSLGIT